MAPCPDFDSSEKVERLLGAGKIAIAQQKIAIDETDFSCGRLWNAKPDSRFAPECFNFRQVRRCRVLEHPFLRLIGGKLNAIHMRA